MADTFGALIRINLIDGVALRDCVVRALWLAHVAVDALIGNYQGHRAVPSGG